MKSPFYHLIDRLILLIYVFGLSHALHRAIYYESFQNILTVLPLLPILLGLATEYSRKSENEK